MKWSSIDSAPTDGRPVWVKRVHEGHIVKEGWAVFGVAHPDAPQRQPIERDPLLRLPESYYAEEAHALAAAADKPKWLLPDLMYSFPEPTHWAPEKSSAIVGQSTTLDEIRDG